MSFNIDILELTNHRHPESQMYQFADPGLVVYYEPRAVAYEMEGECVPRYEVNTDGPAHSRL